MAWTGMSRIAQQVLRFAITVVLARLLTPHDFGLVGLIAVFTGFAGVFIDFGFGGALVQRRELSERHLTSAFWLNVASSFVLFGIGVAAAPLLAAFYNEPRLTALTIGVALNFPIAGVTVVQGAILQRKMDFRRLAFADNTGLAVGGIVAIISAVAGYGVWSLIVMTLTSSAVRSLLLWLMTTWHPSFSFERSAVRELWSFSSNLLGVQALNYWSRNADNLLIGRFIGVTALGIYTRAYGIMLMPLQQIWSVTSRVMFPALSKLQHSPDRVRGAYLRAIGLIALVTFPCVTGLLVAARPFIVAVYGARWTPAIVILQLLCISSLLQTISSTSGWIFQSQGRTDWMLRWNIFAFATTIAAFVIGLHWGLIGVAAAYAVRTTLLTYWNISIPGKLVGVTFGHVVAAVRGAFICSLGMAGIVWPLALELSGHVSAGVLLTLEIVVGCAGYLGLMRLLAPPEYREFMVLLARARQRGRVFGVAPAET